MIRQRIRGQEIVLKNHIDEVIFCENEWLCFVAVPKEIHEDWWKCRYVHLDITGNRNLEHLVKDNEKEYWVRCCNYYKRAERSLEFMLED